MCQVQRHNSRMKETHLSDYSDLFLIVGHSLQSDQAPIPFQQVKLLR